MQTATLKWTDPAGQLTGVEVSMRVVGAPDFTVLATIPPGVQTDQVPDLAAGDYEFRVVALNGTLRAAGVTVSGSVAAPPVAPGDVTGLTVTFA